MRTPPASDDIEARAAEIEDRQHSTTTCTSSESSASSTATARPSPGDEEAQLSTLTPEETFLSFAAPITPHDTWAFADENDRKRHHRDNWTAVGNFHPGWFGAVMGTGMVGVNLHKVPYRFDALGYIVDVLLGLTTFLFVLFTLLSITRYILWPSKFSQTLKHPTQSLTLAMLPMSLSMVINLFVFKCVGVWGTWAEIFVWVLWWIDVAISATLCLYIPFLLMTVHTLTLANMTGAWLLPPTAATVSAASASILAGSMTNPHRALICIIASYMIWGMSVPLCFLMLGVYFQRLILHHLVPEVSMASSLIPIGPMGIGAFCLMQLGRDCRQVFPQLDILSEQAGEIIYIGGLMIGLCMWGITLIWLWFAVAAFAVRRFPFNLGWWALVFPFGAWNVATCQIGEEFDFAFFKVLATIVVFILLLNWLMVFSLTLWRTVTGQIFLTG